MEKLTEQEMLEQEKKLLAISDAAQEAIEAEGTEEYQEKVMKLQAMIDELDAKKALQYLLQADPSREEDFYKLLASIK